MKGWNWLMLAAAGCGKPAQDRIIATGTVEMTEVDVAPQVTARVLAVNVEEGEAVRASVPWPRSLEQQPARRYRGQRGSGTRSWGRVSARRSQGHAGRRSAGPKPSSG